MPFVHIRSQTPDKDIAAEDFVSGISSDLSAATGIDSQYVTVTWQHMPPSHFAVGGNPYSAFVDVLVPDVYDAEKCETILRSAAAVISQHSGWERTKLFINLQKAQSGQVYDSGKIIKW